MPQFPAVISLADLDGTNGFRLDGIDAGDQSGTFSALQLVASAGDVNGDGFDDVIVGAPGGDPDAVTDAGESYVVFGKASGFAASLNLASLNGINGFRVDGIDAHDGSGPYVIFTVASAGDVNGDGFDDLMIGASGADPAGEAYVVFGKASGFDATLDLAGLDGTNGFRLDGDVGDGIGNAVSSAGDVNGDGFDDVIVGAQWADPGGTHDAGVSCVVFGKASGFASALDLASLNGTNGFRLVVFDTFHGNGHSVASAGDVNGDGFGDLIIGADRGDPDRVFNAGESYVVFGKASGFQADFDLSTLDGNNGFRLDGIDRYDFSGCSVASAGDVNGDGFGDLIVGADRGDPGGDSYAGESYVVFGKASGFAASLDLASLNGINGFRLDGIDAGDRSGGSVASAGDVNGDGFDDLIIGALGGDPGGNADAGESYVMFGKASGFAAAVDLASLNGINGFRLDGIDAGDVSGISVASAGDVNDDGFDDIIIGAIGGDPGGDSDAGESYVIFGHASTGAADDDFAVAENGIVNGDLFANNGHGVDTVEPPNSLTITRVNGSAANVGVELALASGALITVEADGSFSYDTNGVFDDLPAPASGASNATVNDTFTYRLTDGSTATVTVTVSGLDTDDRLEGTDGADTLFAGKGDDRVFGLDGDDALNGGTGNDQIAGGDGNDTVEGGKGSDTLFGGDGTDTLNYAGSTARVIIDLGAGTASGGDASGDSFSGFENVTGSDFNDILAGNAAANVVDGGDGVDSLSYAASAAGVTVKLDAHIAAGGDAEGDTILDIEDLIGSGFNDVLRGDDNANRLTGGNGRDRLRGNLGSDVFDFNDVSNNDWIIDFTVDPAATTAFVDLLDLSGIDAKAGTAGNQAFSFIGGDAFTAEGQVRAVQRGENTLVCLNTVGKAGADVIIGLRHFTATDLAEADVVL